MTARQQPQLHDGGAVPRFSVGLNRSTLDKIGALARDLGGAREKVAAARREGRRFGEQDAIETVQSIRHEFPDIPEPEFSALVKRTLVGRSDAEIRRDRDQLDRRLINMERRRDIMVRHVAAAEWLLAEFGRPSPTLSLRAGGGEPACHAVVADLVATHEAFDPKTANDTLFPTAPLRRTRKFSFLQAEIPDATVTDLFRFCCDLHAHGAFVLPYDDTWFEAWLGPLRIGWYLGRFDDGFHVAPFVLCPEPRAWIGAIDVMWRGEADPTPAIRAHGDEAIGWVWRVATTGIALVGFLASRSAELTAVSAPERLNRQRARQGREPIDGYSVVTVRPVAPREAGDAAGARPDYRPRRMHWRRGHVRRLASGRVVGVAPCLVGAASEGFLATSYRVLMGRRTA